MMKNREAGEGKEFEREIDALSRLQYDESEPPQDMDNLRALVRDVKREKVRSERLAFMLFAFISAVFLAGLCFAFFAFSPVFILVQIASLLPLPFIIIQRRKKVTNI